jgi:acyl-CoA synthetase (NDP forming)
MTSATADHGIAIVGASERSFWTLWLVRNLRRFGYEGQIWGVNPRVSPLDFPLVASLAEVQCRLDAVVVAVRASACAAVVEEAAGLGVQDIAVVANGFAEAGDAEGRALEKGLHDLGRKHNVRIYGPNGIGFADFARSICLLGGPIPRGLQPGDVDVISQSGSLLLMVMQALTEERVGMDWCLSLGNGASTDFARAVEICLDRPGGGPICGYLESLGSGAEDVERLAAVLDRAADMSRQVALVKLGSSPTGVKVAQAHTASIAGDEKAVSSFLQRHGVVLTRDIDDLARHVNLARRLARAKRGRSAGIAVIEGSGGSAGLTADLAAAAGLQLAEFTAPTQDALAVVAGPGSYTANPIDLTASPKDRDTVEAAYQKVYEDPNVGAVLVPFSIPFPLGDGDGQDIHRFALTMHARLARRTGVPAIVSSLVIQDWTGWTDDYRQAYGDDVVLIRGTGPTIRGLAHLFPVPEPEPGAGPDSAAGPESGAGPAGAASIELGDVLDIAEGRAILEELGIAVTPGAIVREPGAAAVAARLRMPVIGKAVVRGLAHKARYGLIRPGCVTQDEIATATREILGVLAASDVPAAAVGGVLFEEMCWGTEIFVGLRRVPLTGPLLVVGLGGAAPESRTRQLTSTLPLRPDDLAGLDRFLRTYCELTPGGAARVLAAARALCDAFTGGALAAYGLVEVNPLIVDSGRAVAADVVITR